MGGRIFEKKAPYFFSMTLHDPRGRQGDLLSLLEEGPVIRSGRFLPDHVQETHTSYQKRPNPPGMPIFYAYPEERVAVHMV